MFKIIFSAFIVVFLSGILSMIEASLFSYSLTKAKVEANKGNRRAKKALEIREGPFKTIASFVILSTAVSTVGSIFIGTLAASHFSSRGIGIFSGVLTFLVIIFSEIIPKNIGERWNHIIFPVAAGPLQFLTRVLYPLTTLLEFVVRPITFGKSPFTTSEEEIALLTSMGAKEGIIEKDEAEMIQRVFRLNDITAGDMMTPKPFVSMIDADKTIGEIAEYIKSAKHSRLPVFDGEKDNIVGIVHQRDLLRALADGGLDQKIAVFLREAMFVPESKSADDLLRDFQEKRSYLAVVVNDYGSPVGVVGLEDVLEELVGEIIKEKDVGPELIKRVSKNEILAHGQTRIFSINHFFNVNIKSHKTLNGFLLEKFGQVPGKRAVLEVDGLILEVEESGLREIERVRIIKKANV